MFATRGELITLSGIDGAGKTTQIESLKAWYQGQGSDPICYWSRGGYTSAFNALKAIARRFAGSKLPRSGPGKHRDEYMQKHWIQTVWLTTAILDLIRVYGFQIRWWLLRGNTVLCDRYLWDTLLDFKLGFPNLRVERWLLWKILVWMTPHPDASFLLLIPLEESERRCKVKHEPFPDTPKRREQRYALYQEISKWARWRIVNASRSAKDIFDEIVAVCAVISR